MTIKTPKKYAKSRLFGNLIRQVNCLSDNETVQIISESNEIKKYYVYGCLEYSADYILCELQNEIEIKVNKY